MSGTTQEWSYDSPGGRRESEAAVREGIARAVAAVAVTQVEAEQFMTANGAGAVAPRRGRQGRSARRSRCLRRGRGGCE
jgi:hypothetical protein